MERPLIGITAYNVNELGHYSVHFGYVDSLRLVGAIPVILPPGESSLQEAYQALDGIVFSGGGDIHPQNYNGDCQHKKLYGMDAGRDATEIALLKIALEQDKPVLAVCRGMQLANVVLGGTLMEDLADHVGEDVTHRSEANRYIFHKVVIKEGSKLLPSQQEITVSPASWHHQAVKTLGKGLHPIAFAEDGLVEAFEKHDHPWFLGVQWHPEITAGEDDFQRKLFAEFVEKAAAYKQQRKNKA